MIYGIQGRTYEFILGGGGGGVGGGGLKGEGWCRPLPKGVWGVAPAAF